MSILKNAVVRYIDDFISVDKADEYFNIFNKSFDWKYSDYNGSRLNRQTVVFADDDIIADKKKIPKIWGDDVVVYKWTPELLEVKTKVEQMVKELTGVDWKYNIALGNRYTKGKDFISFHSDREEMGSTKSIASISLGIPRTFHYISNDMTEKVSLRLNNGSLIFMGENCQENYKHGMRKEKLTDVADEETLSKYKNTRINITFRVWEY
jgi:alkylated DNA repair dioxygenase AlkB